MKTPFVIVLLMASVCSSQARIGETLVQIVNRYGEAFNNNNPIQGVTQRDFRLHDFIITVTFLKDRSIRETYSHASGRQLKDSEIEALLKANSSEGKWEKKSKVASAWNILKDDKLIATAAYNPKDATLTVQEDADDDLSGF